MCELIRARRYRPLPVKQVQIPKEDGSKRNLGIPAVKDRWIEQATYQVLSPICGFSVPNLEPRGLHFTRYADDCIICVRSETAANRVMNSITRWLEEHLRVTVNATKTKVTRPNQCKYLGFSFYKKDDKWNPKPHLKSIQKLKYKIEPLLRRNWGVSMEYRIKRIN